MSDELSGHAVLRHTLGRAALERARAGRAADIAARHERLSDTGPQAGRALHLRMARTHRQVAARHEAAAAMHSAFAAKLVAMLQDSSPLSPSALFMSAVASAAEAQGAAVTLFGRAFEELLCAASDARAKAVRDLEFVCGEGPTITSAVEQRIVTATGEQLGAEWPAFGSAATALGLRRVVAVPVTLDGASSGALTVFDVPTADEPGEYPRLRGLADALFHLVLPDVGRETGEWASFDVFDRRSVIHQAAGMVAEQMGCGLDDAQALLRAHAYSSGEELEELAKGVVERRVRFDGL
ncbi:MAG TPA: ANTAR domain-containing protein [Actinospica sp.]|nr:ANTAR domain-containing protein [Actinospica sp.]